VTKKVVGVCAFSCAASQPATASLPYKVEAAPLTTSILLIIELGIPDKPYTVPKALMGMPSMVTIVYGPSKPLIRMSPVLQTLQLFFGTQAIYICNIKNDIAVGFSFKKVAVIISTGTGFSKRLTGFNVPDITTSLSLFSVVEISKSKMVFHLLEL
jgi:hypothetical protein